MHRYTPVTRSVKLNARTQGSLNLVLSGFTQQRYLSTEAITKLVTDLPARHLSGLREITYQPKGEHLYPAFSRAKLCTGEFIQESRKICIYKVDSPELLEHVILHEIGHYVYHTILPQNIRYTWANKISPKSLYVSQYAKTSISEDFAESYAYYRLNPSSLRKIPKKYLFFQNNIFNA